MKTKIEVVKYFENSSLTLPDDCDVLGILPFMDQMRGAGIAIVLAVPYTEEVTQ